MDKKISKNYDDLKVILSTTLAFIIIASFLIFVIFFAYSITNSYIEAVIGTDKFYNGTTINEVDISGLTKDQAIKLIYEQLKKEQEDIYINVYCEDKNLIINGMDFDYNYDIEKAVDLAYEYARSGSKLKRYIDVLFINNKTFFVDSIITEDSIDKNVNFIISKFDDEDLEAHVESFNPNMEVMFTYLPGRNGVKLDRDEVKDQLSKIAQQRKSGDLFLKKHEYKNTSTIEDAKEKTQLIGEFKTISTNSYNSNQNMKLSMKYINGTILNPGDIFSFNGIVGDSNDPKRGFLPGASILNGNIVMAYGGGVCQAATTVYGAAIRADMTILERRNHRFKSSYVPYGLDATIDYETTDLKFRNDLPYPVYIKATMKEKVLECKIYGPKSDKYDAIEIRSWVTDKTHGVKAEAEKMYLKDNKIIDRKELPSSSYVAK